MAFQNEMKGTSGGFKKDSQFIQAVTKNTFIHFPTADETPCLRRTRSIPANMWLLKEEREEEIGRCSSSPGRWHYAADTENSTEITQAHKGFKEIIQAHKGLGLQQSNGTDAIDNELDMEDSVTVMMKNIPCGCSQQQVLDAIADVGFKELLEFFYLPTRRSKALGYAFVGFADPQTTKRFASAISGYRFQSRLSSKVVSVAPARVQGLKNSVDQFRRTQVMSKRSFVLSGAEGEDSFRRSQASPFLFEAKPVKIRPDPFGVAVI